MGLFTKKDPCAICGGKVKALFPWRIEGQLVCNECHGSVDVPDYVEKNMTISDFRSYMTFREENAQLKQNFQVTQQIDFGWLDTKFMFDMNNSLLCMDKHLNKTIFEGAQIKSFVIREDNAPLFEGSTTGLIHYVSTVPDRVMAMAPQFAQIQMQMQLQRTAERLVDRLDGDNDTCPTPARPQIDLPEPFENFVVEIHFEHPYWDVFTADMAGPRFDNERPDLKDYLNRYNDNVTVMGELANALKQIAFPGAPEQQVGTSAPVMSGQTVVTPAVSVAAVSEIQRFKSLMEQGIITEEEFAAKKRQLLGI